MIRVVCLKELVDHLRDRRSILGVLILPILGPLLVLFVFNFAATLSRPADLPLKVEGLQNAPGLQRFLENQNVRFEEAGEDVERQVLEGTLPLVMRIPAAYGRHLRAFEPATIELVVDGSNTKHRATVLRTEALVMAYGRQLAAQRLMLRGVAPLVVEPVRLRERDLATPEKRAATLLNVVPLLMLMAVMVGGMNLAIDSTAGERERGSLEPLLLNPVARGTLVTGKWLAAAAMALLVAMVTVLAFALCVPWVPAAELGLKVLLGPSQVLETLLVLAPLAGVAAAVQMLVATFARSFKEAQTYLNLLNLVPTLPALLLMLNPGPPSLWMYTVPTLGQVVAVVDILRGQPLSWLSHLLLWTSAVIVTSFSLWLMSRLMRRETIIYGR